MNAVSLPHSFICVHICSSFFFAALVGHRVAKGNRDISSVALSSDWLLFVFRDEFVQFFL